MCRYVSIVSWRIDNRYNGIGVFVLLVVVKCSTLIKNFYSKFFIWYKIYYLSPKIYVLHLKSYNTIFVNSFNSNFLNYLSLHVRIVIL